jgi:hypothetical protein
MGNHLSEHTRNEEIYEKYKFNKQKKLYNAQETGKYMLTGCVLRFKNKKSSKRGRGGGVGEGLSNDERTMRHIPPMT